MIPNIIGTKAMQVKLLLFVMVVAMTACSKQEPIKFSGKDVLYFLQGAAKDQNGVSYQFYNEEKKFTFHKTDFQYDTIATNVLYGQEYQSVLYSLRIQAEGRASNKRRKISIKVEGEGKEYVVLPHPDSMYIEASEVEYFPTIKIARPPASDTGMKSVTLYLTNNEDFTPEVHAWSKVVCTFGNWIDMPEGYNVYEGILGAFSPAKLSVIQQAANREGAAFWESNPDAVLYNNYLPNVPYKQIGFNPFTMDDLFRFFYVYQFVISYPLYEAHKGIALKMKELANAFIVEKRNAGNPVLDGQGKEVSFPK